MSGNPKKGGVNLSQAAGAARAIVGVLERTVSPAAFADRAAVEGFLSIVVVYVGSFGGLSPEGIKGRLAFMSRFPIDRVFTQLAPGDPVALVAQSDLLEAAVLDTVVKSGMRKSYRVPGDRTGDRELSLSAPLLDIRYALDAPPESSSAQYVPHIAFLAKLRTLTIGDWIDGVLAFPRLKELESRIKKAG